MGSTTTSSISRFNSRLAISAIREEKSSSISAAAEVHREYHHSPKAWIEKYGTHQELLKKFWRSTDFEPGEQMFVGMAPKRAE